MKKCYLGIGILLFAILLQMTSTGIEIVALVLGLVGLGFCLAGFTEKSSNGKIISILRKLGIASLLTKLDTHLAVGEQCEPIPARDAKGKAVHFCIE